MTSPRFWTAVFLLVIAGGLLLHRGNVDSVPASTPLGEFPSRLGDLRSIEIPLDQETLDTLGKGYFLNRIYRGSLPNGDTTTPVSLFIGYFPTQRSGQSIHSPQNCLPGAGWAFDSSGTTEVDAPGAPPRRVGEYVISNGTSKAEVLYWYQSHGRSIANDYKAKLYMVTDSIRLNRTDAGLVRIVTPILPGEPRDAARVRALSFARAISPVLPAFIPN